MFLGGKTEDAMQPRILGISQIWHKLLTWSQVTFIMTPSFFCLLFYFWGIHLFSLDLFWLIVKWKLCINYSFIVNGDGSMVWSRKPWLKPFVLTIICIINITLKVKFHVTKWHVYNWWFFFFFDWNSLYSFNWKWKTTKSKYKAITEQKHRNSYKLIQ